MARDLAHNATARKAEALLRAGQAERAVVLFRSLLSAHGRDGRLLFTLGSAELGAGLTDDALDHLSAAARLWPEQFMVHLELARAYTLAGRYDDAERALDRAEGLKPDLDIARAMRAELLATIGRRDEADALTHDLLDRGVSDPSSAAIVAALARPIGRCDDAIALLRRFENDARFAHAPVPAILFRLGDLLDDQGQVDEAFAAYERANTAVGSRFDPIAHARAIDAMIDAWSPEAIERLVRPSDGDAGPIFIVGMPRSGTSLVEQILSCCEGLHAGGERPELRRIAGELSLAGNRTGCALVTELGALHRKAIDRLARRLTRAYRALAGADRCITDKLPENCLHLGLIRALLPGARVVICRRDPLDVGLSCYRSLFSGVMPWAQDLEHIASYSNDCDRAIAHWQRVLDLPMLEVRYEQLIDDQEAQTRRLISFAGLDWTDACLEPHKSGYIARTLSREQVRQPMHRGAIGRHERYAAFLEPLRAGLAQ